MKASGTKDVPASNEGLPVNSNEVLAHDDELPSSIDEVPAHNNEVSGKSKEVPAQQGPLLLPIMISITVQYAM